MHNNLKFVLIILCLASISACNSKCAVVDIQEPTLTAVSINDDSYFVYADSITNAEDSFWVDYFWISHSTTFCHQVATPSNTPQPVMGHYSFLNFASHNIFSKLINPYTQSAKSFDISTFNDIESICFNLSGNSDRFMDRTMFNSKMPQYNVVVRNKNYSHTCIASFYSDDSTYYITTYYDGLEGLVKLTYADSNSYHAYELVRSKIIR